jgi:hypothetical protein
MVEALGIEGDTDSGLAITGSTDFEETATTSPAKAAEEPAMV